MSSKHRLSKRTVDALIPGARDAVVFDSDLPGFGVKVTPGGRKVFLFQYRFPPGRAGTTRRYTIGTYSEALTPDQARTIATRLRGKLADGIDPMAEKEQREEASREAAVAKKRQ